MSMKSISLLDAAKIAWEALDNLYLPGELDRVNKAIDALRPFIEQAEQQEQISAIYLLKRALPMVAAAYEHGYVDAESVGRDIEAAINEAEQAQPQRWAVYCGICRKQWSVPYYHPGKSVCDDCKDYRGIEAE